MVGQQDIIWNEQCLGIRVGEQVCTYLKKHHPEYQRLQKEILELTEKYPAIDSFMDSEQKVSLTAEEHRAIHQYFELESEILTDSEKFVSKLTPSKQFENESSLITFI